MTIFLFAPLGIFLALVLGLLAAFVFDGRAAAMSARAAFDRALALGERRR